MIDRFYVIYEPVSGGYWSESYSSFKGIIFATKYEDEETAAHFISKIPKTGYYTTQLIYQVI